MARVCISANLWRSFIIVRECVLSIILKWAALGLWMVLVKYVREDRLSCVCGRQQENFEKKIKDKRCKSRGGGIDWVNFDSVSRTDYFLYLIGLLPDGHFYRIFCFNANWEILGSSKELFGVIEIWHFCFHPNSSQL